MKEIKGSNNVFIICVLVIICITIITITMSYYESKNTNKCYMEKKLSDWELLKVAIIWQESKGNSNATGGNGYGIYQITPIYVKECNRILDTTKYRHIDAFVDSLANDMFEVVQSYHNTEKCPKKATKLHNRGDKYYQEVMDKFRMLKFNQYKD